MTITLKQLRNNPGQIAKLAQAGEVIHVTRRGRPLFDLVPAKAKSSLKELNRKLGALWKGVSPQRELADEALRLSRRERVLNSIEA